MISKFKNQLSPIIAIISQPFLSWNPSVLTFLSLVAAVLFFIGIMTHAYFLALIGLSGFLFDAIDGYVARHGGKVTQFGGFLDSTLDRASDFLFMSAFAFGGFVSWPLAAFAFGTSYLISYMRSRGELAFGMDKPMNEGLMQRSERILLLIVAFIAYLFFPGFVLSNYSLISLAFLLLIILNTVTIFQRFIFFYNRARRV